MSRYAIARHVYFVEEPIFHNGDAGPTLTIEPHGQVIVVVPQLPATFTTAQTLAAQRTLLNQLIADERITRYALWYYTPAALRFTDHLMPETVVYDCMDELSAFKHADPELPALERALFRRADLVLTGGHSLYEAKKHLHSNIHPMPSSVDVEHFAAARRCKDAPPDQQAIPHPRLGFFGVLDERLDLHLLAGIADAKPHWQLIMVGPVVKIDPADLPRRPNIHYLGPKSYIELPRYIAGWDVALVLFARNEATRFISPTKTPEYLAAGKPVVSTSIRDVVNPYEELGLVRIADSVTDFVRACEGALTEEPATRRARADAFLRTTSWDRTWSKTALLLQASEPKRGRIRPARMERTAGLSLGA
ncbi:MAG TPA: glycosyltransferase [Vicinamibacterales bacterium]|nr:glycosyltransferase [Vicinamibacterales bacterium]